MSDECEVLKNLGLCVLCGHRLYEDKTYPSWMACYCPKPELEVLAPVIPPVYYDDYC